MACVTVAKFLSIVPELAAFGGPSSGTLSFVAPSVALDTLTIGAHIGAAVTGPRSAGSNNWSVDGPIITQLASLTDMLNDTAAGFAAIVSAFQTDPLSVLVTSRATGITGNIAWSTSNPTDIVLDPLGALSGATDQMEFYLECACSMVNFQCWGIKFECGVIQLAAHLMTVASGADAGTVTSKKIDKISVSYASTSFDTSDAAYVSTRYGRNYIALRETIVVFPVVGTGAPRAWPRPFGRSRRG